MAKILVHVTCGPNDPTRAALAFLVARAAVDEGHNVNLFLAGDAVQLLREAVLDSLVGLGTEGVACKHSGPALTPRYALHSCLPKHGGLGNPSTNEEVMNMAAAKKKAPANKAAKKKGKKK